MEEALNLSTDRLLDDDDDDDDDITTKTLYAFLSYSMHATCSTPIILINVITLIISDEYKS